MRTETYGGGREYRSTRRAKDAEAVLGESLAVLIAIGAGALALIGLLVGFNIIETDNPYNNGLLWLMSSVIAAIGANVFRREPHVPVPPAESTETRGRSATTGLEAMVNVGNGMAVMTAIGAGALGVIGLLVGFDNIGTDNPFNNGVLWLVAGIVTAICANVFRREHHVFDESELRTTTTRTSYEPRAGGAEPDMGDRPETRMR